MSAETEGSARTSRIGAIAFTLTSAGLAAMTAYLLYAMLAKGGYTNEAVRDIVVATKDVEAGHPLQAEDIKLVKWPMSAFPPGAFTKTEELLQPQPRIPNTGVAAGEPVLASRLASPEAGPGLASMVPRDWRAATVRVDRGVVAARFLFPGARVDVLVTLRDPNGKFVSTRTVLENVKVLAVGKFADIDAARRQGGDNQGSAMSSGGNETDSIVTLEVTPRDAERLTLSAREGKIDLVLRNVLDNKTSVTQGVTNLELIGEAGGALLGEGSAAAGVGGAGVDPGLGAPSTTGGSSSGKRSSRPSIRISARDPGSNDRGSSSGDTIEVYRGSNR